MNKGGEMSESSVNINRFTLALRNNAKPRSIARCARFVRLALEAGGAATGGHPANAKDWEATLLRNGYRRIAARDPESYGAQAGDVAIIQPYKGGNPSGHIQAWDGRNWISDFVQRGFWPGPGYRNGKPEFAVYRALPMCEGTAPVMAAKAV